MEQKGCSDTAVLDIVLEEAKAVKDAFNQATNEAETDCCEDYLIEDADFPEYYWGGEDGCEIFFRDDQEIK